MMLNKRKIKRQIKFNTNKYSQTRWKKNPSLRYSLLPTRFLRFSFSQYKNYSQINNTVANLQEESVFSHTPQLNFGTHCYKMLWIAKEQTNTKDTTSGKKDLWGLLITKVLYSGWLQCVCTINTSKEVEMAYYLLTLFLHFFPEHRTLATAKERIPLIQSSAAIFYVVWWSWTLLAPK